MTVCATYPQCCEADTVVSADVTIFGIHTNVQGKPLDDLLQVWSHCDSLGYQWLSVSDHLPGSSGPSSIEATTAHAALALNTERATCAVLTYVAGFRHPAVIASAAISVDHLSGGRAAVGLGSGSLPHEFEMYGFGSPSARIRTDILEESTRCVVGLVRNDTVNFAGEHFRLVQAKHEPPPIQERLPVWLGVAGPRGIRIAAELADGWNAPYLTVEAFAAGRRRLHDHCDQIGRARHEMKTSVNLLLLLGTSLDAVPEYRREAALAGSVNQVVDQVLHFADVGADQINFLLPHPWDLGAIEELAGALGLVTC